MKPYKPLNDEDEYDREFEKDYSLESSITMPKLFSSEKSIKMIFIYNPIYF